MEIDGAAESDVAPAAWTGLYPWQHEAARDALRHRDRWPHALLIAGRDGIGKRAFALELARSLLCETPDAAGFACGGCASCRYAAAGQHPDLRIVLPFEIDEDNVATPSLWINVGHIRALIDWAALTSHRRVAKVAVIVPAERMNPAAANALLKTLEEPPSGTFLMLVAHQPGRLPPTIRSRCQWLAAPNPTPAAARTWLIHQGVAEPEGLLSQSGGAPLAALRVADAGFQAERSVWLDALALPATLDPIELAGRIDRAPRDARKALLGAAIDWLMDWCVDLAAVGAGGAPTHNPDYATPIAPLAATVAPLPLFRYHRSLLQERAQIAHPLQPRLVAEALLFEYQKLFG
ncbi:MAG TPA: DNA polymerase III subunit delta' [Casimicrobiaceae bacterium]